MELPGEKSQNSEQSEVYPYEEKFRPVTVELGDALDFLNEINIYNNKFSEGEWIFRGQNNANWCLIPSIFRDNHVFSVAEQQLENYWKQYPNDAISEELRKKDPAYSFLLARVCAAVEHDRVNAFVIQLDNADIGIPYHSNFHHPDYSPEFNFDFLHVDIASRVAQRSNFRKDWLKREVRELVTNYPNLPQSHDLPRSEFANASYEYLEQRYFDISFALAQHSGLPTGLLDWTRNPLVAAFYAAYIRESEDPGYQRITVWALESSLIERNILGTRLIEHPKSYVTNIHAQSAVFTRDAHDWRNYVIDNQAPHFERYIGMLVDRGNENHRVWRITLPFEQRHELLRLLRRSNISLSTLEPTHYHVAEEVSQDFNDKHNICKL